MLIPIIVVFASIIVGAIFGFNFDYDFKNVDAFNVKFNTTVTTQEYKELENLLNNLIKEDFSDYRIERIGEGAQNGLLVKIANDGSLDTKIDSLKTTIEEHLLDNFSNSETLITVTTTDTDKILPKNAGELLLYSAIAVICIMIFVFLYNTFRYNFVSGITIILTILLEIGMLTSVMIVARVPFNYYFVISYFVMIVSTIFITTYINNQIKSTLNLEKYNKYSNAERICEALKKTLTPIILFVAIMSLCLFAVICFGYLSLCYTIISILIANVITLFGSLIFNPSIWSFWYQRDKDTSLRRRIEFEKKKFENKDNDKIVV